MAISVLIADDHRMFRQGLKSVLEADYDIRVIGEAENGSQAVELCGELRPDVVVLDVTMPEMSGIVATRLLRGLGDNTKVIMLTMHVSEAHVVEALKSGARGYVLKDSAVDELVLAIKVVHGGGTFLSPKAATVVVKKLVAGGAKKGNLVFDILSHREVEVLQLLCEGKSVKETAETMGLSPKTVDSHRANIMGKLDIRDVPSLVKFAIRMGITEP
jgi:DNA-binding NarL/FixJ family response regulator